MRFVDPTRPRDIFCKDFEPDAAHLPGSGLRPRWSWDVGGVISGGVEAWRHPNLNFYVWYGKYEFGMENREFGMENKEFGAEIPGLVGQLQPHPDETDAVR